VRLTVSTWIAALGCYFLLAGSLAWTEAIAAAPVAVAVAAFVWRQDRLGKRIVALPPPRRALAAALATLVPDTLRVGAVLARALVERPRGGEAAWQAFRAGGPDAIDAGRRAVVTVLASMAPNGFVLEFAATGGDHGLLLHRLASAPPVSGEDWPS
jgi:hypothetical protein